MQLAYDRFKLLARCKKFFQSTFTTVFFFHEDGSESVTYGS